MPVSWYRPQVVMVGEKVYVGGGISDKKMMFKIHIYNLSEDRWRYYSRTRVALFGMAYFKNNIITVGGTNNEGVMVGEVCNFDESSRDWKECVKKMPTARASLSVLTTSNSIVACGGMTLCHGGEPVPCATVEVYTRKTGMWYKADSLPYPCATMSSTRIGDKFYLLGEIQNEKNFTVNNSVSASIAELIERATSPDSLRVPYSSSWKTLPAYPLVGSAATSLSGTLITVGGHDNETQPSIYVYWSKSRCWKKAETSDMPVARGGPTAIEIARSTVLVMGGEDFEGDISDAMYVGFVTS